jgi:hypothetical protein
MAEIKQEFTKLYNPNANSPQGLNSEIGRFNWVAHDVMSDATIDNPDG